MNKKLLLIASIVVVVAIAAGGVFVALRGDDTSKDNKKSVQTTSPAAHTDPQNVVDSDTPAITNSVLTTHSYASVGQYLADPKGNTLYVYDKDSTDRSSCAGECLDAWPIYEATGSTTGLPENVGTIKRSDNGKNQYTYKGQPLYYYTGDSEGQVTGDGLNDFHVIKLN
jgi:predicted lipoprotein with Yx(FWY)xxD motif